MTTIRKVIITRHELLGSQDFENNEPGILVNEIIYNDEGHVIERLNYNQDGVLEEHIRFQVVKGMAVEEVLEIHDVVSEKVVRTFDDRGRVASETKEYSEGGSDVTFYKYDGDKLITRLVTDSDGEESEKDTFEYEHNRLMREASFNMFGSLEEEKIYDYDDEGKLSTVTEISYHEEQPVKTISVYGENGQVSMEKKYDSKQRLVARTIIEYDEAGRPVLYEEENTQGKKLTRMEYDEAGNNTLMEESGYNGERVSLVKRSFDGQNRQLTAEILMEPGMYRQGHHYALQFNYEFFE